VSADDYGYRKQSRYFKPFGAEAKQLGLELGAAFTDEFPVWFQLGLESRDCGWRRAAV
jgi:hypothetical protein